MLYGKLIKPLLFSLPPEQAHHIVTATLSLLGKVPGGRWLLHKLYATEDPSLEREVFGIRFKNPVGMAAGFDRYGHIYRELSAMGFGFVEVGSITPKRQPGNPKPRIFRLDAARALLNRVGICSHGLDRAVAHLRQPRGEAIVGCNIGKNTATPCDQAPADYLKCFRNLYQYADYFTINVACDPGQKAASYQTRENITKILEPLFEFRRGQNQYRPILLKVSPDLSDETIDLMTDIMLDTPLDGMVAVNATVSREGVDRLEATRIGAGVVSGQPLTQRALEVVRRIHTRSQGTYPIIGVGGLMTPDDVRAMLDAGAALVQIYTGYIYNGPGYVREICRALLEKEGRRKLIRSMKATIITIGDEILIGQIVDTNSASIARHLNAAGIVVAEKESVGDDRDAIVAALRRAMDGSDVTILTGGLGPTKDDITKRTLAELFGCELVRDERVARHVRRMLESRGIAYNDLNRGQSLVPACCTVLFNAHGTAPGMWFERDGRVVVSLPGVPFEMEHLMQDEVMPRLKARFALRQIVHRTLITSGLAESMLAERIAGWEAALPPYLHLAYLPSSDKVRLRLSAYEVEGEEVAHEIEAQFEKLRTIIPEYILGYETATIQSVVHDLLTQRHLTLATAESCTGGAIAARFTAMPGASAYFRCGVVSYTVEAKHDLLGVSLDDIDRYGVVSEPVVRAMAEGMRRTAHADYAVATTGVAGPAGGTPECPVGTVWMAVAGPQGTVAVCRQSGSDRGQIIDRASGQAIALLRDEILRQDTPRNE